MTIDDPAVIAARNIYRRWKWANEFTFKEIHQEAMIFAWQRRGAWNSNTHAIRDLHYQLSNWVRKELRARGWKSDRSGKNWTRREISVDWASHEIPFNFKGRQRWTSLYAPDTGYLRLAFDWPEMTRGEWDEFANYILTGHPVVAAEFEALEESGQRRAWKEKRRAILRAKHAGVLAEARLHAMYGEEGIRSLMAA